MLRASGASLVRRKRHQVWRLPNGRNFVHSSSASDHLGVRNAVADLRRLLTQGLASHGEANDSSSVATEPAHRGRFHAPNRPERADGIVVFPTSRAEPKRAVQPRTDPVALSCLDDLLDAVDGVEAFWKLDSYGRIRVLQKLAQPFAEVKTLYTLFFSATAEEIEFANADPDDPRTEEWIVAGFGHFTDRDFWFHCSPDPESDMSIGPPWVGCQPKLLRRIDKLVVDRLTHRLFTAQSTHRLHP
jgi:hypothetical protein